MMVGHQDHDEGEALKSGKNIKIVWFTVRWVSPMFEVEARNCSIATSVALLYITDYSSTASHSLVIIIISSIYNTYYFWFATIDALYYYYSSSLPSRFLIPWQAKSELTSGASAGQTRAESDLVANLVAGGRQIKKQKLSASVAATTVATTTTDDGAGTISIGVKLVFIHFINKIDLDGAIAIKISKASPLVKIDLLLQLCTSTHILA